jgi:hypothetical protein
VEPQHPPNSSEKHCCTFGRDFELFDEALMVTKYYLEKVVHIVWGFAVARLCSFLLSLSTYVVPTYGVSEAVKVT